MAFEPGAKPVSIGSHRDEARLRKPILLSPSSLPSSGDPQKDLARRLDRLEQQIFEIGSALMENMDIVLATSVRNRDAILDALRKR